MFFKQFPLKRKFAHSKIRKIFKLVLFVIIINSMQFCSYFGTQMLVKQLYISELFKNKLDTLVRIIYNNF